MRQLATIQRIADIQPIEGADAIEKAQINAWWVVVKKAEHSVGESVVYLEVDSFVLHSLAPFLTKPGHFPKEYKTEDGQVIEGQVLRTVKLRGQLSQGLILPLSVLGERTVNEIGQDVTADLGIVKYEPPIAACLSGIVKGAFPTSVPKTDEERIQNLTSQWEELRQYNYEVSEKLEGSSMTVGLDLDNNFVVCSRNLNLKEDENNTFWKLAIKNDIEFRMREAGLDMMIIQGELVGEGVEGNHYEIKGHEFYVYSMYLVDEGKYLDPITRIDFCKRLGLKHVPVLDLSFSMKLFEIDDVLRMADGQSAINVNKKREGLVFKRSDGQEHWKAVSNLYLLKTGK